MSAALSTTAFGNADDNRPFDLVFDRAAGTGRALLAYSDTAGIKYRSSSDSGATWSAEQTLDNARTAYWLRMEPEPSRLVHLAIADANDDLQAWTWDGAAWKFETPTPISSDLEVNTQTTLHDVEPFGLTSFPGDGSVKTYYRSIGTAADYTTGTVTIASVGSTTVTGAGTTWLASNRGRGDRITIGANNYVVLRVDSNTQLTLASPAVATATNSAYTIARQFTTLQNWENCISFAGACGSFPVASADLVDDNRREIGIAYKDSSFTWLAVSNPLLIFDGTTTDPTHSITLTADGSNRHYGLPGTGVVVDNSGNNSSTAILVLDDHVTIEWLEILSRSLPPWASTWAGSSPPTTSSRRGILIVHDTAGRGINLQWPGLSAVVSNNFVYNTGGDGIHHDPSPFLQAGRYIQILNNTVRNAGQNAYGMTVATGTAVLLRNNACSGAIASCFQWPGGFISPSSSNNFASEATGVSNSPAGGGRDNVPDSGAGGFNFVDGANGNLHLQATSVAIDGGADLSALITAHDIDGQAAAGTPGTSGRTSTGRRRRCR